MEAAKVRPRMRPLETTASRTGKPVQSFLKTPKEHPSTNGRAVADARVEELQALCLQQQFDKAIALGLPMLEHPMVPSVEAQVRHYVGQALVRSMRPDEGLEHLRRAQDLLEQEPDPWLAVECADWEACAPYLKEDSRALAVAGESSLCCLLPD